jgi:putative copper export protein
VPARRGVGWRVWTIVRKGSAVVGRLVEVAAAAIIAWRVLVTMRGGAHHPATDGLPGRIDASVARTLAADHVLSLTAWAGYLSTTLVLGGLVFRRFVSPTDPEPPRRRRRGHRRSFRTRSLRPHPRPQIHRSDAEKLLRAAIALGFVAGAFALPLRAVVVSDEGLRVLTDPQPMVFVLNSPFGNAALVRIAGLGLIAVSRAGGPLRAVAALAGSAVLLASYLMVGHPQANHPVRLEIAAQAVHITAVSVWFAGVAFLAVELRQRRLSGALWLSGQVVSRFSRLAEVMVVLVLASGAVLTAGQVKLHEPFWTTPYGKALIAKLAFVAVVLAIGGYNRQKVVPGVADHDDETAWRHLRATCIVESTVIALGVLLMTAAMTSGGFT